MAADAARRAAVLGHPIAHSLSPVVHRAAYAELGLPWRYDAVDVASPDLPEFLVGLGPEWVGLSLTMPLKEAVLPLLDEIAPDAAATRAVNTVVLEPGHRRGYNTDIAGLTGLLRAAGVRSGRALVVGAGATARSAVAALAVCGVHDVAISARRVDAAAELAASRGGVSVAPWPPTPDDLTADVVISTIPATAAEQLVVPPEPGLLVDVLYDPWPTPLAAAWAGDGRWARRGRSAGRVVGGLELLLRQAVEQVVLMTGRRPDLDVLRAVGQRELDRRVSSR